MPESGVTKHNYLFCQFVNPARGHEGDRCDCFDTPSQRRTTLAKQRLARLRANREINRASTSNNPESAVASDPAVTLHPCRIKDVFHANHAFSSPAEPTFPRMVSGMDHTRQSLRSKQADKDIRFPSQYPSLFARQTPWRLPHSYNLIAPCRTGQRIRPIFSDVVSQSLDLQFSSELPDISSHSR